VDVIANIRAHEASYCFSTWHDTFIQVWSGTTTIEGAIKQESLSRDFVAERGPGRGVTLLVVEHSSSPPTGEILERFSRYTRDVIPSMAIAVGVADGGGFRMASMRTVAAGVALLLPKRVPWKFADSVEAGVAILAPHLTEGPSGAPALVRAVGTLREHVRRTKR
jgi:hypothetical protein